MRFMLVNFSCRLVSDYAYTVSCGSAPLDGFCQRRIIAYYGKDFSVFVKSRCYPISPRGISDRFFLII